jgi:hypothetical protein
MPGYNLEQLVAELYEYQELAKLEEKTIQTFSNRLYEYIISLPK